jgi:DNA modification methylase
MSVMPKAMSEIRTIHDERKKIKMGAELKGIVYIADSRNMAEIADESVHLIVTSPPYWHIKDYGVEGKSATGRHFTNTCWI